MSGVEIAAIITAILGGLAGVGAFIKTVSASHSAAKRVDLTNLELAIEVQHRSDAAVIHNLQASLDYQGKQILALSKENNSLHDTDNALRLENGQLRSELEAVRNDNRKLQYTVSEQARQITELQNENTILRAKNIQLEHLTSELGSKLEEYRAGKRPTGPLDPSIALSS